jgi:hypothetical protein
VVVVAVTGLQADDSQTAVLAGKAAASASTSSAAAASSSVASVGSSVRDRSAVHSVWKPDGSSPPYVAKYTLFAGEGSNPGMSYVVRKLFNIKLSWRDQDMTGPNFLHSFDSEQFRFLSRAKNGYLVVPPLGAPTAAISVKGLQLLKQFVKHGKNTLIVCGGFQNLLFLNDILPVLGFDGDLQPEQRFGIYEQQQASLKTRFKHSPVTLPGDDVWGVSVDSLPKEAISIYEQPGVVGVFDLKVGKGRLVYVGFSYSAKTAAWSEVLYNAAGTDEATFIAKEIARATGGASSSASSASSASGSTGSSSGAK